MGWEGFGRVVKGCWRRKGSQRGGGYEASGKSEGAKYCEKWLLEANMLTTHCEHSGRHSTCRGLVCACASGRLHLENMTSISADVSQKVLLWPGTSAPFKRRRIFFLLPCFYWGWALTIAGSIFGSRFSLRWAATSRSIQGGVVLLQSVSLRQRRLSLSLCFSLGGTASAFVLPLTLGS